MSTVRMGSDVAEAQISDLSDPEVNILLEIYEVIAVLRVDRFAF
ncbi:MAG: hypothetical protein ACRDNZ_19300 [Streptosporangiaceae bacterium]